MAEFEWAKETLFNKIVYCFGWLNVFNLVFWASILMASNLNHGGKFWNKTTHFVVYVWGWIIMASILIVVVSILGLL